MQVVERNFEKRLPKVVELDELQMVFMPERAMLIIRQMVEKYEVEGRKLYMVFGDL